MAQARRKNQKLTIGIDLDGHARKAFARVLKQWQNLPLRVHTPGSLHIPLVQLGWVDEAQVLDVIELIEQISVDVKSFAVHFEQIVPKWKKIAQRGEIQNANTIVCQGTPSEELLYLHNQLMQGCGLASGDKRKAFAPQIELAQIRKNLWQELAAYPEIDVPFGFDLDVMQITLFEQGTDEHGKNTFLPLHVSDLG